MAASARARLMNVSKASGEDFAYVLTRYGLERFLARLAGSEHREAFTLKGAMLFRIWSPTLHRPTKDLDLLGTGAPDIARLEGVFRELCAVAMEDDDGVTFDAKSVRAARIKEDAEYEGVRVTLTGHIGTARLDLQVDVGFGDAVTPAATVVEFPTLLGAPPPKLRAYPRESVVAEKLEAMVHLGVTNSRMKDFFDVWFLSQTFAFDGTVVSAAILLPAEHDAPLVVHTKRLLARTCWA
jgi:predicted nucleotidyltransferase component of viral defense system